MIALILKWLGGPLANALTAAYKAKLAAANETERLVADGVIADVQRQISANRDAASVVREGMQHRIFWVAWAVAALPTAAWYGWGVMDSMANGALPDVAALPPQLKAYADVVFANIFYSGAGMAGVQVIASAIRGRK